MQIFKSPNFNFIQWRWYAFALSAAVILGGIGTMIVGDGLPLGVDFSGGTIVVLRFEESVTEEAVRGALDSVAGEKVVQQYGDADANEMLIRLPEIEREEGGSLEEGALAVVGAIEQADLGSFELLLQDIVGPVIGRDLQRRGIYAFLSAMTGILIYIGLRFRFSFAVGAIVAVAHDILVTVSFLLFFGYELSLNVVAAMLTITGYSVNDTIVIFDRVRENLRSMRRDSFDQVVNTSINHTLGRTIITSGTTGMAVLALFVLGGEVLRGFAFTMLVGVVAGTYSTIFVAAMIAVFLNQRRALRLQTAPAQLTSEARSRRQRRKARAS